MLIDTHAHLDFPEFAGDIGDVIARAHDAGVTTIIAMAVDLESSRSAIALSERFPNVWACVGIHPLMVGEAPDDTIAQLRKLAAHPRVAAIGEIGLDYHAPDPDAAVESAKRARQELLFQQQLELAAELGLNANLHIREGFDPVLWADAIRIVTPFTNEVRACFHCFKGKPEQVEQVAAMGHLVSFTAFISYPELPQIPATAAVIPAGTFMVETDCPFMHPPPEFEARCEPMHTRHVAERIADLRSTSLEAIAAETSATARAFYSFQRGG
jgi:TatD DNase family protein